MVEFHPVRRSLRTLAAAATLAFLVPVMPASAQDAIPEGYEAVISKLKVKIYGYAKGDVSYDAADTSTGEFVRWLEEGSGGADKDGQFNMTARQTRLGLSIEGPSTDKVKTGARVEVDFYSGGFENAANPRLRHGYVNVEWPEHDLSLLVGQSSDVVSPLVATTVNYTVAWWTGDIGYRRTQVRLTKGFEAGEDIDFLAQVAALRSANNESDGRPGFQGRLASTFPGLNDMKTTVGVSFATAPEQRSDATAIALDFVVPITERTTFKSEFYTGENVDAFLGGIGQGVNAAGDAIDSTGFWANVIHKLDDSNSLTLGYAADSPDDGDLDAGMRETNSRLWANIFHKLNGSVTFAFELAHNETEYLGGVDSDGLRAQGSVILAF